MAATAAVRSEQFLEVFDAETGRIDARAVADELAVPVSDLARAIGKGAAAVRKTPDAPALQDALAPIVDVLQRLAALFQSNMSTVRIWLNAPNRGLGGEQPMRYLLSGRVKVLDDLVGALEEGFTS